MLKSKLWQATRCCSRTGTRTRTSLGRISPRFQARGQAQQIRSADRSELRMSVASPRLGAFSAFCTRSCHPASSSFLLKQQKDRLMSKCLNARLRPESKPVHIIWVSGHAEAPRQIIPAAWPSCDYTSMCRMSVTGVMTALMMPRVSACWQGASGGLNSFSLQILPASKTNLWFFLQSTVNVRSS